MAWSEAEEALLRTLDGPPAIQRFLDSIPYSSDPIYRCPKRVLADRTAHCFDGAMFAAAALRRLGQPPLLVDLRAERDDDHVLALFRRDGRFGAVAKSNCVGLRYREPIHRTLRELVLSYFEDYFNLEGLKSLRAYSRPLDLSRLDRLDWTARDEAMEDIALRLDAIPHVELLTPAMRAQLVPVDARSYQAGLLGSVEAGLYDPRKGPKA